jgi:hypothetical protein
MNNILNSKEIFSILTFILVLVMVTDRLSPSYAVPINYSQLNSGYPYDNGKRHGDDNAFSDLSRSMTFSAQADNLTSIPPNSRGPNFAMGDVNNTWRNNIGSYGFGDNDISSGSIFTQHGFSNSPGMWNHRFH